MTISKGWNEWQGQVEGTCHCTCVNCHTDCLSATVCTQDSYDVCTAPHGSLSELVLMYTDRNPPRGNPDNAISEEPEPCGSIQRGGGDSSTAQHADLLKEKGGGKLGRHCRLTGLIMVYSIPVGAPLEGRRAQWHICALTRGGHEQQRREEGVVSVLLPWWNPPD